MAAGSTEETFGLLLNVLAQSLDVQEVFARISALARQTVPHDCLLFGLVTEDGERYRVVAVSEDDQRARLLGTSFAPPSPRKSRGVGRSEEHTLNSSHITISYA